LGITAGTENSFSPTNYETTSNFKFRFVFWDVLPCKIIVTDVSEVHAASIISPDDGGGTYL
jgi:hypothetical protein